MVRFRTTKVNSLEEGTRQRVLGYVDVVVSKRVGDSDGSASMAAMSSFMVERKKSLCVACIFALVDDRPAGVRCHHSKY